MRLGRSLAFLLNITLDSILIYSSLANPILALLVQFHVMAY